MFSLKKHNGKSLSTVNISIIVPVSDLVCEFLAEVLQVKCIVIICQILIVLLEEKINKDFCLVCTPEPSKITVLTQAIFAY